MKKIVYTTALVIMANFANAQVAIGKEVVVGNNTILDFNSVATNTNGIILPAVDNVSNALAATTTNNNGTFLFDKSDNKVKMYEFGTWKDMSGVGNSTKLIVNTSNDSSTQQGVIMGADTSNAKGVLVLESATKAMILPKIANPHLNVKSPYPGMMCYDTTSRTIAVFDGALWNYWK